MFQDILCDYWISPSSVSAKGTQRNRTGSENKSTFINFGSYVLR